MTHGSLFSGIGGFDLAARWAGWTNVFHVEKNPFGQRVLAHHFPESKLYEDVTTFDGTPYRGAIDVISGGFPCQPFSMAGQRKGTEDERHLWPQMLRVIREIAPRYVVGENVFGLVNWSNGEVFADVVASLEAEGYQVGAYVLPASAVEAPHRRDRIWFVAHAGGTNGKQKIKRGRREQGIERDEIRRFSQSISSEQNAAHAENIRCAQTEGVGRKRREHESNNRNEVRHSLDADGGGRNAAHAERDGLEHGTKRGSIERSEGKTRERVAGHTATESWARFPTQPPVCGGNDGLPTELDGITFSKWRAESIAAYGNAVVPQLVYEIFESINEFESQ